MARTKNPRSHIIDKLLAEVPFGQSPNFKEIAEKVLQETGESEEKFKKVVSEIRVRHWMFTKGGKVNKFRSDTTFYDLNIPVE